MAVRLDFNHADARLNSTTFNWGVVYASFSWSEFDSLFFRSPELSIVCDDEGTEVALPGDERKIRVADLSEFGFSSRRHAGLAATRAMLALAKKHRLIVHCA